MFISSAFFQKYERFVDKSAKVLLAETVALTSDRMFVEIRYKSLYMETNMVKQIISPPIKLFTLAEIFICKQRNNKILTSYGRRNDTFCANRPLTGVTITFIRCLYRVTGVSIGQCVIRIRPFIYSTYNIQLDTLTSQPVHFSLAFQLRLVCITKECCHTSVQQSNS